MTRTGHMYYLYGKNNCNRRRILSHIAQRHRHPERDHFQAPTLCRSQRKEMRFCRSGKYHRPAGHANCKPLTVRIFIILDAYTTWVYHICIHNLYLPLYYAAVPRSNAQSLVSRMLNLDFIQSSLCLASWQHCEK